MNTWEFGKATEKALHDNACTDVFTTISLTEFFSVSFFISTVKLLGQIKPRSMVVKHTSSQGKGKITFHTYADKWNEEMKFNKKNVEMNFFKYKFVMKVIP